MVGDLGGTVDEYTPLLTEAEFGHSELQGFGGGVAGVYHVDVFGEVEVLAVNFYRKAAHQHYGYFMLG